MFSNLDNFYLIHDLYELTREHGDSLLVKLLYDACLDHTVFISSNLINYNLTTESVQILLEFSGDDEIEALAKSIYTLVSNTIH